MFYMKRGSLIQIIAAVAIILMATAAVSCKKKTATLYPWGWEATGHPTDSLMVTLQKAFLGDTSLDSCIMLVDRFHEYADSPDAFSIEKARAIFWDARLAFATEEYEESANLFRKALAATDSARYPYDAKYIHLCLEPLEGRMLDGSKLDWEWYLRMTDDLEYSLCHGARFLGALRAQYLCCFMTYSGNPSRALHYALLADSLFTGIGRDGDRMTNRMNVASNRVLTGDTVGALADYEWIQREIDRGVPPVSPLLIPLIDYNRWQEARDTTALRRLKQRTRNNPVLSGYNAIAAAYLAEIEIMQGRTDSLVMRLRDMVSGLDMTDDLTQKAFVAKMLAQTCEALGEHGKATQYFNLYTDIAEENVRLLSSDRYIVAETERMISGMEREGEIERMNAKMRLWGFIAGFAVIGALLGLGVYRWIKRLYKENYYGRKELEKSKRSELSMSLSVQEKEHLVEELRKKINMLVDDEVIDGAAAREIRSSIRSEQAASKADEEFGRIFAAISPDFRRRLRERYPRIGRNTLRMAEYIAIGMDNRHIARVMNIRPESVKQNRWRLRQALGLDTDDNLDKVLSDML